MKVNPYVKSSDNHPNRFTDKKAASILGITIEELRRAITNTNSHHVSIRVSMRASMRVSNKVYIDATNCVNSNRYISDLAYANANTNCCTNTLC